MCDLFINSPTCTSSVDGLNFELLKTPDREIKFFHISSQKVRKVVVS